MNAVGILRDAYRHMEWADARVWSAVLGHDSLRADDATWRRLHHLHLVQHAFLRIWRGEALEFAGVEELRGEALAEWARAYHGEVADFLAGVDEAALDRTVELPWAERVRAGLARGYSAPRWGDTALQVVLHSAHHRGQAVARIHELGIEPPLVDYVAWAWSGRPDPAWETLTAPVAGA